ncbi:DUF262 domain-containing protein [Methylobacterium sp. Leaf86]|uniref:DUF262 domain-containing protein n=1 Tax=Methylobacterium sp. Leaf86 TaxID=1736242 RepID=UPI000A3F4B22|nr:DUF262 domain-containing protein [Methylobacterium sp. Leaf86]
MKAPSFYSDPHVQFLSQLLEEIGYGHLQVPRFQRPMVWNWERRRELLRSIRDGIPIGAIMVWRTSGDPVECYKYLGPHKLTPPPVGTTRQYLLDGVQRLSTLYGALQHKHIPVYDGDNSEIPGTDSDDDSTLGDTTDFDVLIDLVTKDFCTREDDIDKAKLMPLHLIFDSIALLKFQRGLKGENSDALIEASDQIARAFRDYKIPIIPITTDDVDMATRTFQRINSQGARMSEVHMVHALTWTPNFDLQSRTREVKAAILNPRGWGEIDDDVFLKACKAAFGLDVYKTNAQDLSDKLRESPLVIDNVGAAIARSADFLWNDCGVPAPDLVPYGLQIVTLAEAFRHCPTPDRDLRRLLYAWFWMTTYGELFAGMSGDRVQVAIADMVRMLETRKATWSWKRPFEERPLSRAFDFRAARAKAFAFRLAAVQDRMSHERAGTAILADAGRRGLIQLLPLGKLGRGLFSGPANRFLVHPNEAALLRDRLLTGAISDDLREMHLISDDGVKALNDGDYDHFINCRLLEIQKEESDFIRPIVALFVTGGEV